MLPRLTPCTLTARTHGRVTTICLLGDPVRLDHEAAARLAPQLLDLVRCCGTRELVLDFRHVRLITGAGLRLLLRLRKQMLAFDGQVRLQHVAPRVAEVFEVTKVGRLFGLRARVRRREGWFLAQGDTLAGPVSTAELRRLVAQQQLSPNATVWRMDVMHPLRADRVLAGPRQ